MLCVMCCCQAPKNYNIFANGGADDDDEEEAAASTKGSKKRASKKAAASGSARQQLTGFEGCTHLFSEDDMYPAYQQGRCQAFHSGNVSVANQLPGWYGPETV